MKTPTVNRVQHMHRYISTLIQLTPLDAGTNSQMLSIGQWQETNTRWKIIQNKTVNVRIHVTMRNVPETIVVV
jgi:hypothetical protein